MAKVLYITANVKRVEDSCSLTVGEAFINEYKKNHPTDTVTHIDLFNHKIASLNGMIIACLFGAVKKEDLDPVNKSQFEILEKNVAEFLGADRYVFAIPLWNLGSPAVVKAYFDNISIVGKTFKYTATGPIGLLQNKKAICIQAAGGIYSTGPMSSLEHSMSYIHSMMNFFGVTDFAPVWVEGVDDQRFDRNQIIKDSVNSVIKLAKNF